MHPFACAYHSYYYSHWFEHVLYLDEDESNGGRAMGETLQRENQQQANNREEEEE